MKILCFSDVHLDAVTAGVARFDEIAAAMHEVVRAAVANRVALVVFVGDLCDPDSACAHAAAEVAVSCVQALHRAGINSRWLVGNHDVVETGDGSSTLSALRPLGVLWSEPQLEFFNDASLVALPYTSRAHAYDPAHFITEQLPDVDFDAPRAIVFSHLGVEGIGSGSETHEMARGRDVFLPRAALRKRMPHATIVNGHYHAPQLFDGDVLVVGSLVRLRFDEARNETGYAIIEV